VAISPRQVRKKEYPMRVYIHTGTTTPTVRDAEPDTRIGDLIDSNTGDHVFARGQEEPVDLDATIGSLSDAGHVHLHVHGCRKITVSVRYNGATKETQVPPGHTMEKVLDWAIGHRGFNLDPAAAADLTLRVPGSDLDLDLDLGIDAYAPIGTCAVLFDLLPVQRFAG